MLMSIHGGERQRGQTLESSCRWRSDADLIAIVNQASGGNPRGGDFIPIAPSSYQKFSVSNCSHYD